MCACAISAEGNSFPLAVHQSSRASSKTLINDSRAVMSHNESSEGGVVDPDPCNCAIAGNNSLAKLSLDIRPGLFWEMYKIEQSLKPSIDYCARV
jgi:hypothetical protein